MVADESKDRKFLAYLIAISRQLDMVQDQLKLNDCIIASRMQDVLVDTEDLSAEVIDTRAVSGSEIVTGGGVSKELSSVKDREVMEGGDVVLVQDCILVLERVHDNDNLLSTTLLCLI